MRKLNILFLGIYVVENQKSYGLELIPHHLDLGHPRKKIYDVVFVLNSPAYDIEVEVYRGNVFALMQEPGISRYRHPFMFKRLDQYDQVVSILNNSSNTIQDIPYLNWYISLTYQQLKSMSVPIKNKKISCVMSNNRGLYGHIIRYNFMLRFLKPSGLPIDFFGKGYNYIKHKEEGLLNYKYSVAVENSSQYFYFTEKITDCFLCYTIPFYYGCKNIDKYFPKQSYVWIDIDRPFYALDQIRDILRNDDYQERSPYLQEARDLVLKKYNIAGLFKRLQPTILNNINSGVTKAYKLSRVRNIRYYGGLRLLIEIIYRGWFGVYHSLLRLLHVLKIKS